MGALTAIEFGSDTCTLVRARPLRDGVRVDAVEVLDPAAFPGADAFAGAVRQTRRKLKLPRRTNVVLWGMPAAASPRDPSMRTRLSPLTTAGFRVDRVVRPADALLALSALRRSGGDGAVVWLAIDRSAVAVAVTRAGALLHAHEFAWDAHFGAVGSQAQLLQRYSQVAYLAPEVRRAMIAAREQGAPVEAIVTCGNLPDLRSLTMPLTQELDIEVETMDSLDGIEAADTARERVTELAPAIRLATAPIVARGRVGQPARAVGRAAAVIVLAVGAGYLWYALQPAVSPVQTAPPKTVTQPTAAKPPVASRQSAPSPSARPSVPTVRPLPEPARPAAPTSGRQPARVTPPTAVPQPAQTKPAPAPQTRTSPPAAAPPATTAPARNPAPPARTAPPSRSAAPELLKDPLPRVNTILVSADRQVALVDGQVVGVGDRVGQRVVSRIEGRSVIFREPSGVQIRVGLGGRFLGVVEGRR